MGYNRIGQPRIYTDTISNNLLTGWRELSNISILQDDDSTSVSFDSGTKRDLFDLRPANYVQIAKENQQFYIQFDTGHTATSFSESNYLAILNHNFKSADCVFKIEIDASADMSSSTVISASANHTSIINGAQDSSANFIDPTSNGWTLITWDTKETDNRYVRITFADDSSSTSNFNTDLIIGSIMFGEYFDIPHSPDLSLSTSIDYDGVKTKKSLGGNTYSTSTNLGQPNWQNTTPFTITGVSSQQERSFEKRNGRKSHSMNFSYLTDTDVFSSNDTSASGSEWFDTLTFHNSFYNKIIGQHLPFLFCINGTSTNTGDYGMYRLKDKKFTANQSANNIWDVKLNIEESW